MPPKAAEKKPSTGGKAPAGKTTSEKKEAGKKTAAPSGDKKKRNKTRKETYSSYIYKGMAFSSCFDSESRLGLIPSQSQIGLIFSHFLQSCRALGTSANASFLSPQAGPPRYWYFQPCHVYSELFRQRHLRARRHRGLQTCCL